MLSSYVNSRIGYNIEKYSNRVFSTLTDVHTKYINGDDMPNSELTKELYCYLKDLKSLSKYQSFEEMVKNFTQEYHSLDKLMNEIYEYSTNPYFFCKKTCELSQSSLKWIIKNNPPCSELSPFHPVFLEKCV